ncbi:YmfL family putative regulatory protein [Methylophaga sp.]|uniref:YmfL family putative regulatory protein n=1 Tax=Methylophaga sp. TaxID=2024840 RepID=UPI003A8EE577
MNKKEMVNKTIAGFPGGKEAVAAVLGMSVDGFNNRLYEKKNQPFFTVDELETMASLNNTPFVAEYFAERVGRVTVDIPNSEEIDKQELYDSEMFVNSLSGQLKQLRYQAQSDGMYDPQELADIECAERKYIAALVAHLMKEKTVFVVTK